MSLSRSLKLSLMVNVYFTHSFYKHLLGAKVKKYQGHRSDKHEYVDLVAGHILTIATRPHIKSFLEGFSELVPRELISIFNDEVLEMLIIALPDIEHKFA